MTDDLVQAIYQTLTEYGESVLSTPQSLEVVLARLSKASPNEIKAISAAVQHGAVQDLRFRPDGDVQALSVSLASRSGLPQHAAKWSLDVWKKALLCFDARQPPPSSSVGHLRKVLSAPMAQAPFRTGVGATVLIALVGAVAGLLPGVLVPWGLHHDRPQASRIRQLIEKREQPGTRMSTREFTAWIGTLGALGGLIGSTMGWLGGGFQRPTAMRIVAGVIGAMWAFDGAVFGAVYGGIIGTMFGSMLSSTIMTFLAVAMGRYAIVLILKPLAWLVLPHFA